MHLPLRYLLVQLTVDNRLLAFRIMVGQPWTSCSQWEIRVLLGRAKVPEGCESACAVFALDLGRHYESVIDHNHERSWKRFLPWGNWCRWHMGCAPSWAHNSTRWTGRPWIFTGIDWPLRCSFWRAKE